MQRKVYLNTEDFLVQNNELQQPLKFSQNINVLSSPVQVGGKTIANRLVCQPMEGCDGTYDGRPGELTLRKYRRLAAGGAGLIWLEAVAVQPDAKANPRQLCINKNNIDSFKHLVEEIKQTGFKANGFEPVVIMQATHSGRYSKPREIIAYNHPILEANKPISSDRIITDEQLDTVKENLINAAVLAQESGFDGVDIKCCHRYLLNELLSAYNRTGRYGGSFENRTRMIVESIQGAMQSCRSGFLVTSRLNVYDGFEYPYGFGVNPESGLIPDFTEPILLIQKLRDMGVKLLNITMGNPYYNPHVNRPFAVGGYKAEEYPLEGVARMLNGTRLIQKAVPEVKMVASGLTFLGTVSPNVAAGFIEDGGFALAGFGRMILAYPDFANDIFKGRLKREKCCIACSKCTQIMRNGGTPGCVVKDSEVYLPIYNKFCIKKGED
ncbi:MAG TPA: NADH:flavin oxidoreductase [Clostridiales bacterium]|nr:NADH:flavin oxidoreductase [Clostridiales bacterium]